MKSSEYKALFEGKFTKTFKYEMSPIEKIYYAVSPSTYGERKLFQLLGKHVSQSSNAILDIGCGGGHFQLVQYGKVYGIDISTKSLKNARKIYHKVVEADASKKIPFASGTFDIVFCSEVFGHIDKSDKGRFMREVRRVLKKNGIVVFSIETVGKNSLTTLLKQKKMYKKYWIDHQGHIGLETPTKTRNRFAEYFSLEEVLITSSHILPVDGYMLFSDKLPILRIFDNAFLRRICNVILFPFFYLSLKMSKFDDANDIIIVARKS